MAKLVIKFNDVVIDQITLKQGDMSLGRRPGNDILLDNMAVSGSHATLFTVGEDTFIQDTGSTNGTLVNNKKITKHHLVNGDIVTIGSHTLIYVNENATKPANDLAKTMIITPPPKDTEQKQQNEDLGFTPLTIPGSDNAPKGSETRVGSIFVLSGANSGKRIDLTRAVTHLGRAGKTAGSINRSTTSGYSLVPSSQGELLKLNGNSVSLRGEELKNGDIIEIAGSRMQFYLK